MILKNIDIDIANENGHSYILTMAMILEGYIVDTCMDSGLYHL